MSMHKQSVLVLRPVYEFVQHFLFFSLQPNCFHLSRYCWTYSVSSSAGDVCMQLHLDVATALV